MCYSQLSLPVGKLLAHDEDMFTDGFTFCHGFAALYFCFLELWQYLPLRDNLGLLRFWLC